MNLNHLQNQYVGLKQFIRLIEYDEETNTDSELNSALSLVSREILFKKTGKNRNNSLHNIAVMSGMDTVAIFTQCDDLTLFLFRLLDGTQIISKIIKKMKKKFEFPLIENWINAVLMTFFDKNFLITSSKPFSDYKNIIEGRYGRQIISLSMLYNSYEECFEIQKKLKNKKIMIIGSGGLGSSISYSLSSSGIGNLVLIDHDFIELSNLNRQFLFTESDIGLSKVKILQRELKKRNKTISVTVIDKRIKNENDIKKIISDCDLVILTGNTPVGKIVKLVNRACVKESVPFVCCGYIGAMGIIGPLVIPGTTSCIDCMFSDTLQSSKVIFPKETYFIAPSTPQINNIVSGMIVNELLKFFTCHSTSLLFGNQIIFDLTNFSVSKNLIPKNNVCKTCSSLNN